jgi:HEAT repeat protein
MADATGKKLLRLLRPDSPSDLRAAAARVLGSVAGRDAETVQALRAAVDDPDQGVRLQAFAAIGELRIEQALPQILTRIREGGPEAEAAAQAGARLGAKGTRALQALMGQVAPGLRRRIASALGLAGTASSGTAAVDVLLDSDPGVVDAAVRSLLSEVPTLSEAQRRALADRALELVKPHKGQQLSGASEAALVRLLAGLGDPRGEAILWERIAPSRSPDIRIAALQALGALTPPKGKDRLQLLFTCAADPDFRVAAPALMILKSIPVTERNTEDWLPLLQAPDVAVRRFAIDQLAGRDTSRVAAALVRQLGHPDHGLRQQVQARLGQMKLGREALADALLDADSAEAAWSLARVQAPFVRGYDKQVRSRFFARMNEYLEAGDRRADALLFLLREADPASLRDQLEARALALRKKKDYESALLYLRLLARDPACGEETRFELAACALKASVHDLASEARAADPALQQLARLVHSHETDPAVRLKGAKWLGPDDLYYAGFHFIEGDRPEREFGAQALRLALQRSPRSKVGKDAKRKLRSAGLG